MTQGFSQDEIIVRMVREIEDYAIILLDTNGIIANWNPGAQKIKGYTESDIVGRHFSVFYTSHDRVSGKPERLLDEAKIHGRVVDEGWRVKQDGSEFWGSVTIVAIHDPNGNISAFGKVTRDLTERKRNEQLAAVEARNQELEQFTYIASHDLQEPLRTVSNFLQIINEDYGSSLDSNMAAYLGKIDGASKRMNVLVTALLDYARLGKDAESALTDVSHLLQEVIDDIGGLVKSSGAEIQVDSMPVLRAFHMEMRQLFQNLIVNAIKFSHQERKPEVRISCIEEMENWHFTVTDNGIGIEKRHFEKVFQIFQRIEPKGRTIPGHGIGLANCKKIVTLHGGNIWVESIPGAGSTFHFTISRQLV
jgi:PAS domain S-box-containing protein